jgi:subtilisin family serine protease
MSLIPSQPTPTLTHAISTARKQGIIVVASAGSNNPAVNPYQGSEPDLIQVGTTNHLDQPFSLVTPAWVDIHAPGASSMPVNGLPTAAEAVVGPLGIGPNKEPIFAASTSSDLATAFVSGAAAAFSAATPDWPTAQVPADNIAQRFIDQSVDSREHLSVIAPRAVVIPRVISERESHSVIRTCSVVLPAAALATPVSKRSALTGERIR